LASDLKFAAGEPSNSTADEDCFGAKITTDSMPNNFLLSDYACSKPAKFICEVSKQNEQKIFYSKFHGHQTYAKACPMPTCPNVPNATDALKIEESKKWKSVNALHTVNLKLT
jgi:hypothetical protein